MLKIVGIIGAALVLCVAGIAAYAATQPDSFRVERTVDIKAPAEKIFPHVNNLRSHTNWSPWEGKDASMKRSYSGPESGKGAAYEWDGNSEIGSGRMQIAESSAPSKVVYDMHFLSPFEAHNKAEFRLQPKGEATSVTWAIYGPQPFISKVMCLFFDMDKMIGREFETGLSRLKGLAEQQ